jgi:L-alanine-DL-glutamate epimerase-like enolase superfamily enzyme
MKIESIECFEASLPTRRPHLDRHVSDQSAHEKRTYLLARIRTDNGVEGWGEAPTLPTWGGDHGIYFGETVQTSVAVITQLIGRAVLGMDPTMIEAVHDAMDRVVLGYPYAKGCLDIAIHDVVGKALGVPVYQLLGGLYRRKIPVNHSIGFMDEQRAASEARLVVEEGVKTIKVKVGIEPQRDIKVFGAVRDAVGGSINLTADANQGYKMPKTALKVIEEMRKSDIWFMEQPVEGLNFMEEVTRNSPVPIMADESAWTPWDALEIAKRKAADIISLYTMKPGGLANATKVAAVAEAAGIPCNVNGSGEMGIGNAANVHLAAAMKNVTFPCVIPVTSVEGKERTKVANRVFLDDLVREPFEYEDGHTIVPDNPGLGIEVDPQKLKKYAKSVALLR